MERGKKLALLLKKTGQPVAIYFIEGRSIRDVILNILSLFQISILYVQ